MGPTRVMTKKVWQWIFFGGDPARTVKYHGFATNPPQNFRCCNSLFTAGVGKQEGAPPALAMDFFWGGPC